MNSLILKCLASRRLFPAFASSALLTLVATPAPSQESSPKAAIAAAAEKEISDGRFPGVVLMLGDRDDVLYHEAFGSARRGTPNFPMRRDSLFDVASVTKVVATATACAMLFDEGKLDPSAPLTAYLPDHQGKGVEKISLQRLASHTSGFAANPRLGQQGRGEAMFAAMLAESPRWGVNEKYQYACKGTILLSTIVERLSGTDFESFCRQRIFEPLEMNDSAFNRVPPSPRVVPTHHRELGVSHNVDTLNAGCAIGNAGLFTSASDLANFARMMLRGGLWNEQRLLSEAAIARFTTSDQRPEFTQRAFIWETDLESNHRPTRVSPQAYGHSGYTGQSLWIDPGTNRFVIVLSNRTLMPTHNDPEVKREQYLARRRLGDAMLRAFAHESP